MSQVAEVAALIAEHAANLGLSHLNQGEGSTTIPIDDDWSVVCNPHRVVADYDLAGVNVEIPPFTFAALHRGMLVGLFTPAGGPMFEGAEDDLIAAVKRQLEIVRCGCQGDQQ